MAAKKLKTYYSAVEHLESFWEAVADFTAVKEAEGKRVASALMTDCVATIGKRQQDVDFQRKRYGEGT
jgi:hypothetical protein